MPRWMGSNMENGNPAGVGVVMVVCLPSGMGGQGTAWVPCPWGVRVSG
jgi:hypothetical protein